MVMVIVTFSVEEDHWKLLPAKRAVAGWEGEVMVGWAAAETVVGWEGKEVVAG